MIFWTHSKLLATTTPTSIISSSTLHLYSLCSQGTSKNLSQASSNALVEDFGACVLLVLKFVSFAQILTLAQRTLYALWQPTLPATSFRLNPTWRRSHVVVNGSSKASVVPLRLALCIYDQSPLRIQPRSGCRRSVTRPI